MVYNYFRTYDPSTGRYLESDPIGLGGGFNTYSYVLNAPTRWSDSLGLSPDSWTCNCEVDTNAPKFTDSSNFGKVCAYKCKCSCDSDILSKILPFDIFKRSVNVRSFTFNVRYWNGRGRKPNDIGDFLCFGQTMNMINTPQGPRQAFERFTVTPDSSSRNGPFVNYDEIVNDLANSSELEDCVGCDG